MPDPPADDDAPSMSYVDAVKKTMKAVADIGIDDALLAASYRQLLDQAARLDAGRDQISLHNEFRLGITQIIALAESRRKELAEVSHRPMDLAAIIRVEADRDDSALDAEMAMLPAAVTETEPPIEYADD